MSLAHQHITLLPLSKFTVCLKQPTEGSRRSKEHRSLTRGGTWAQQDAILNSTQKFAYGCNSLGDPEPRLITLHSVSSVPSMRPIQKQSFKESEKGCLNFRESRVCAQHRTQFSKPPARAEISKHNRAEEPWDLFFYPQTSPSILILSTCRLWQKNHIMKASLNPLNPENVC